MLSRHGVQRRELLSQINVTPFVDVMLVLLVIFMVTTPLMQEGVDVNLPKVSAGDISTGTEPVVVEIDRSRRFYVNGKPISRDDFQRTITSIKGIKDKTVLVRADEAIPYGSVMEAMSEIRKAGVVKVGMVTEPAESK